MIYKYRDLCPRPSNTHVIDHLVCVCVNKSLDMDDTIPYVMETDTNIADSSDEFDIRNKFGNVSADHRRDGVFPLDNLDNILKLRAVHRFCTVVLHSNSTSIRYKEI